MTDNFSSDNLVLDLQEGVFIDHQPIHPYFMDGKNAELTAQLLRVMQPYELEEFKLAIENNTRTIVSEMDGLMAMDVAHQILEKIGNNIITH